MRWEGIWGCEDGRIAGLRDSEGPLNLMNKWSVCATNELSHIYPDVRWQCFRSSHLEKPCSFKRLRHALATGLRLDFYRMVSGSGSSSTGP